MDDDRMAAFFSGVATVCELGELARLQVQITTVHGSKYRGTARSQTDERQVSVWVGDQQIEISEVDEVRFWRPRP